MKTRRSTTGPLPVVVYYTDAEIERMCSEELWAVELYPSSPQPIRIEQFIRKRFNVHVDYDDLPPGVLGYTRFGRNGVEGVVVSRSLADAGTTVAERRLNTTLAHEAGHGLLHGYLFALESDASSLFGEDMGGPRILCRDESPTAPITGTARRPYDGRWWEVQANKAIGAFLLPVPLVERALGGLLEGVGGMGITRLPSGSKSEAVRRLSDVFEVNPVVVRIRLEGMYPESGGQLAL